MRRFWSDLFDLCSMRLYRMYDAYTGLSGLRLDARLLFALQRRRRRQQLSLGQRQRRLDFSTARASCTAGLTLCPMGASGFEVRFRYPCSFLRAKRGDIAQCVDTEQELSSCGGCVGDEGVNCDEIDQATLVGCEQGSCVVCASSVFSIPSYADRLRTQSLALEASRQL